MKYSKEEKTMWLEDWKISGKSAWAYAKANGINQQTFINWTKAGNEIKQNFIELQAASVTDTVTERQPTEIPQILIEKGDVKIYIPLVINHNQLRSVMEGLGAVL